VLQFVRCYADAAVDDRKTNQRPAFGIVAGTAEMNDDMTASVNLMSLPTRLFRT